MENEPVEINKITDATKKEMRDFDEQEAYFLLCEIFAYAQATHDYAKFQSDLNEWKRRYNIELFSEELKVKIKYMLSKEFLDKVLKDYVAFDELSKKDPAKGLEQLRKVLNRAEKHKDESKLDKDLEELYKEYPLKFLKEKYPHVISQLLSKSNRTRILEKFDSRLATQELENIVNHPDDYKNAEEYVSTIEEWKKLYPTNDFSDKYKSQIETILKESLDKNKLEELFPISTEIDLSEGEVIPIADMSLVSKEALHDFINIADRNINDTDSLFDWACKYKRYINSFNDDVKSAIVDKLMYRYGKELPTSQAYFYIPKMDNDDLLSLSDFKSIQDTKKMAVLQLLGILNSGKELTHEDRYNLEIINSNNQKAKMVEEANVDEQVEEFIKEVPENELTPFDTVSVKEDTKATIEYEETNIQVENTIEGDSIKIDEEESKENQVEVKEEEENKVEQEEVKEEENKEEQIEVKDEEENKSFKETLKVEGVELERVETSNNSSSNNTTGATSSGGGGGVSISRDIPEVTKEDTEEPEEKEEDKGIPENNVVEVYNNIVEEQTEPDVEAVIIEAKPKVVEKDDKEQVEAVEIQTEIVRDDEPNMVETETVQVNENLEPEVIGNDEQNIADNETVNMQPEIVVKDEIKIDDLGETKEFKTIDEVQPINEENIEIDNDDNEIDDDLEPPIEENTRKNIVQRLLGIFQREKDNDIEENDFGENEIEENEQENEQENEIDRE